MLEAALLIGTVGNILCNLGHNLCSLDVVMYYAS